MRSKNLILFCLCLASITAKAQKDTLTSHILGDAAPKLNVKEWIKGSQGEAFGKNKVHVVEFWATWCQPCIGNMPHLSALAKQYKASVSFSAVDVYESNWIHPKSPKQLKAFVNEMGDKMDFSVAMEDSTTARTWLDAYCQNSVPVTFVVDENGRIAWIGHPMGLDTVLPKVLNKSWDIEKERSERDHEEYLNNLDTSIVSKVRQFEVKTINLGYMGSPDSILRVVDSMTKQVPELRYMPNMVKYTFSALLKTDPQKAYEFGKNAMAFARYKEVARMMIIDDIRFDMDKFTTPPQIFLLGAKCFQENIDISIHSSDDFLAKKYHEMADWYRRGGDRHSAISSEEKAIEFWKKDIANDEGKIDKSRLIGKRQ